MRHTISVGPVKARRSRDVARDDQDYITHVKILQEVTLKASASDFLVKPKIERLFRFGARVSRPFPFLFVV